MGLIKVPCTKFPLVDFCFASCGLRPRRGGPDPGDAHRPNFSGGARIYFYFRPLFSQPVKYTSELENFENKYKRLLGECHSPLARYNTEAGVDQDVRAMR